MQPYPVGQQSSQQRPSIDAVTNTTRSRMNGNRSGNSAAVPMPVGGENASGNGRGFGPGMGHRTPASPPKNKSEYRRGEDGTRERARGGGGRDGGGRVARLTSRADTQHVPCKFFLQGQCQAGTMCPFSHDVESSTRPAPCKYFAKGGCKFGRKCALLHITPDGTVVNRHFPGPPPYLAGPPPGPYPQPPPPGLLSMHAQGLEQRSNGDSHAPPPPDFDNYQYGPRSNYDGPHIDMTYISASPQFGSPNLKDRIAASPPQKGLSVLDAPLPNSFDSNGISWAAKHGPFAASVPSKFDFDSPPSSVPRQPRLGNNALRDLHSSAFGDRGMDNVLASMGSSPPSGTDEPMKFEKRPLHSDRLRNSRPIMSSSLGARYVPPFEYSDEDDGGETDREEDLLPSSLHDLIPDNRLRRESRTRNGNADSVDAPASFLAQSRRTISSHGTPSESKISSSLSSSPSRYTGVFTARGQLSGLGHVGSPLRDSSFPISHPAFSTSNGDLSPNISSPPQQATMSMLTQGLQRTKLESTRSTSGSGAGQQALLPLTRTIPASSNSRVVMDRNVSSSSISQRIEEEKDEIFDMDFESQPKLTNGAASEFGPIGGQRPK